MSEVILSEGAILKGALFHDVTIIIEEGPITLSNCTFHRCKFRGSKDVSAIGCMFEQCTDAERFSLAYCKFASSPDGVASFDLQGFSRMEK